MNIREVTAGYRMDQWTQLIQVQAQSGQNIKEFCATMGISRNTYFYWQRKLRQAVVEDRLVAQNHSNRLVPGGWAKLEITDAATSKTSTVTIEVGGCHIAATMETDMALLQKVCVALRGL